MITLEDFLSLLTQLAYVFVAGRLLLEWARRRDRMSRDIALVFVALAVVIVIQDLQRAAGLQQAWLGVIAALALLAHPYLLLRVAQYFRVISPLVMRAALLGFVLSALVVLGLAAAALPVWVGLGTVLYFVVCEFGAAWVFVRGALALAGVTQRRLGLISAGSGLLAAALLTAILSVAVPQAVRPLLALIVQVLALLSGLAYFLGFSPPRSLRRAWQLAEFQRFLRESSEAVAPQRTTLLERLCLAATRTVGGLEAVMAAEGGVGQALTLPTELGDPQYLSSVGATPPARVAGPSELGPEVAAWGQRLGARSLLVVPVRAPHRTWGQLVVALDHAPVFAPDDLEVLALLCAQSAIALDYTALIAAQASVNETLEEYVAERTAELASANHALRTISDCNQELVRAESEAELLGKICQRLVDTGGYQVAWVGYAEDDERHTIRVAARAGAGAGFLDGLDMSWGAEERGEIPMGRAIRSGQPQSVHIATDPVYAPWRHSALAQGFAACLALPLLAGDKAFGGLGIFAAEPSAFDAAEVKLLGELANDLAYGITALRTRAAHAQAVVDLLKRDELLRQTGRMAKVGGWELDVTTMTPLWSEETYRLHEVDPGTRPDLSGAINFYAPEARPVISAAVERAIADGTPYDLELPFITATGKRLWVRAQGQAEFEGGQCRRLSGIFQDITERKQAYDALRQSEERFAKAFRASPAALTMTRLTDGYFIDVNQSFLDLLGYQREEVIGRRSTELAMFANPDERAALVQRLREQGTVRNAELWMRTKTGALRCVLFSTEMFELQGETHALAILFDITERKRLEEQERELVAQLQRNNRELQDFAYVASHDLQEPLRKIMAFGDRLKSQSGAALDEKGRDYLERMQTAAGRMRTLIDDLLTFSRVTTRAQPFVPVDLWRVATDVLSDLEVRLEKTGGRVEIGDLPTIDADATQMRQVFQNLIGNALKFHRPDETPVVHVSARLQDGACQIEVADNGIGFDEKYLDRIFTPFQRLHGRGEYEGTGIGLAVVRKIAERHGGSVTARSAPGQGATFSVTLPARQAGRPEAGTP